MPSNNENAVVDVPSNLHQFPVELVIYIFKFSSLEDIYSYAQTCTEAYELLNVTNALFWQQICRHSPANWASLARTSMPTFRLNDSVGDPSRQYFFLSTKVVKALLDCFTKKQHFWERVNTDLQIFSEKVDALQLGLAEFVQANKAALVSSSEVWPLPAILEATRWLIDYANAKKPVDSKLYGEQLIAMLDPMVKLANSHLLKKTPADLMLYKLLKAICERLIATWKDIDKKLPKYVTDQLANRGSSSTCWSFYNKIVCAEFAPFYQKQRELRQKGADRALEFTKDSYEISKLADRLGKPKKPVPDLSDLTALFSMM